MINTSLNSYNQNVISISYFNLELLAFHCMNNIENSTFTPVYFQVPPAPSISAVINDNLRDKLRRVNNSVIYLGNAINGLCNYYELLNQEKNPETRLIYQNLYRQMCRNACVELFVYFEKIKSLARYYFNFNQNKTKNSENFNKALKEISVHFEEISELCKVMIDIEMDTIWKNMKKIRNDETHNESQIDDIEYDFLPIGPEGLQVNQKGYFVSDNQLYRNIRYVLSLGNKLRDAMQAIINNINRVDFYNKNKI